MLLPWVRALGTVGVDHGLHDLADDLDDVLLDQVLLLLVQQVVKGPHRGELGDHHEVVLLVEVAHVEEDVRVAQLVQGLDLLRELLDQLLLRLAVLLEVLERDHVALVLGQLDLAVRALVDLLDDLELLGDDVVRVRVALLLLGRGLEARGALVELLLGEGLVLRGHDVRHALYLAELLLFLQRLQVRLSRSSRFIQEKIFFTIFLRINILGRVEGLFVD